ncbi:tRNA (adenosine(37)-N6)-threonylcarbamoyltransferase complex ATPase subunit type 1 TsaE [Sphingomonas sp. gentR]|jgi:tRNA threonylcarbamoyladenosine biosynthesis protein TsaE|uniref:tRNA (adenosine(37)-N6)-threonylcarbamoyltransferase complex ATPase subunit type 1 TsaE n=1 Tax=unclassified Sphingomonas TaxID=196159 RepID=UPI0009726ACD|nr:tRNA (adenosine(37)-N6)-threonylcarbamoyltransferase complex ATPase subunit type 1 TsaE [Sphingomonas sp. LK11]APX66530.1 tRNA threonylcarbamoyladenosine biosynthesis protein TsaE [Sphingomonas sp. LK11]
MTIRLADAAATEEFGRRLAAHLRPGDVVTLTGTLGAGKTSLARGLLSALGLPGEAPSPSFAIVQPYAPPETMIPVLHVDLYRLDGPEQMEELGLDEALWDSALIVEWPDRAGEGAWPQALALTIELDPGGGRILTAKIPSGWENRWPI